MVRLVFEMVSDVNDNITNKVINAMAEVGGDYVSEYQELRGISYSDYIKELEKKRQELRDKRKKDALPPDEALVNKVAIALLNEIYYPIFLTNEEIEEYSRIVLYGGPCEKQDWMEKTCSKEFRQLQLKRRSEVMVAQGKRRFDGDKNSSVGGASTDTVHNPGGHNKQNNKPNSNRNKQNNTANKNVNKNNPNKKDREVVCGQTQSIVD